MSLAQASLFEEKESPAIKISGLAYIHDFITPEQESELISIIDKQPWLNDLKRRVQHYGYKYDYTARRVNESMRLEDMPNWIMDYCKKLNQSGCFPKTPDQVIINEYEAGQGISKHIDCVPCFEDTIASLSLGSACVMEFYNGEKKAPVLLEPRSLVVMSGDARYKWQHSIAGRKTDKINGRKFVRDRRISLTFRNVILAA